MNDTTAYLCRSVDQRRDRDGNPTGYTATFRAEEPAALSMACSGPGESPYEPGNLYEFGAADLGPKPEEEPEDAATDAPDPEADDG